jgi:MOSC domain-containing protein YiiM
MHAPHETWQGSVVSIHVAPEAGAPMVVVPEARALLGRGLEGDRYATGRGHYSPSPSQGGRELTLIETEAVEALDELGVKLSPAETRRNVATRGVPLNHLVGRVFLVGAVRLRGTRLCEPCKYLDGLTRDGVRAALVHRGGLRAQILGEGMIRVGDVVRPE